MGLQKRLIGYNTRTSSFASKGAYDLDLSIKNEQVIKMLDRLVYEKMVEAKDIRSSLRRAAKPVKKAVEDEFKANFPRDPRNTWKGVRIITLRKARGVVVGILNRNKAGNPSSYVAPRGGRSGITRNRPKSDRTKTVERYQGGDRAWIMRILNQGTVNGPRSAYVGSTKRGLGNRANRGNISAKKFFKAGEAKMKEAEQIFIKELSKVIEKTSKEQ